MTEKHFMIDIETTGVDPKKDDLLQIGLLEATFGTDGFWHPGRKLELLQHTDRKPESEFAKEHMAELYEVCNRAPLWKPEDLRWMILKFFKDCGAEPPMVFLMGWNASGFDIPFLISKGILVPSNYEQVDGKEVMRGDFHYRVYELAGAIALICDAKSLERKKVISEAEAFSDKIQLPHGKEHDAVFDCFKQLKILNGLIALARRGY